VVKCTEEDVGDVVKLEASAAMCYHCFDILLAELKGPRRSERPLPNFLDDLPSQAIQCPLFVTWDKRRRQFRDGERFELRGCIGTLSPKPLASSIGEYAVISAMRDRRFAPVSWKELPQLRVAVSLLVNYEECENCHDWSVGVHGIMIRWSGDRGVEFSATYLPEVAKEQGWDQEAAVTSLIRKAGYDSEITDELLREIQCTRYQSSKHQLTYDEYVENRGHDPVRTQRFNERDDSSHNEASSNGCSIM
jgi:AMME syndrome candidate gene 1 protein